MTDPTITTEILSGSGLSLGQAARCFPPYRAAKPVNPSTIYRWITYGVRLPDGSRLRLEARRLGARWLTSREAIQRFIEAQTPTLSEDPTPAPRPHKLRSRTAARTAKELDALGF